MIQTLDTHTNIHSPVPDTDLKGVASTSHFMHPITNEIPFSATPFASLSAVRYLAPKTESSCLSFYPSDASPVGPSAFAPEPVRTTMSALPLPTDAMTLTISTIGIGLSESLPRAPVAATLVPSLMLTSSAPSSHELVLAIVAAAMTDILLIQQKLAFNQDLPPVQLEKFVGTPVLFPLFGRQLQCHIMLWKDRDDEYKMARLLQFIGGEGKEAFAGLEAVKGGVKQGRR